MTVRELLSLARRVEIRVGRLYEHMARTFDEDDRMATFLHTLALQEREHAEMVQTALDRLDNPHEDVILEGEVFLGFLDTIDDLEDEVCDKGISVTGACEVMQHLESSVAERFYGRLAEISPSFDPPFVRRMIESSRIHLREVETFRREVESEGAPRQ